MTKSKKPANRLPTSIDRPIPYGKQHITEEDIAAVVEVLRSDFLTQGPKIQEFEEAFAEYIGCKYAVSVSNGTAALHLSTMVMGVKPGDKVITTPITFAASANCVRYCGGEVVFADIDPETYLLDINKVRELLEASPKGTYKGIIPVDFAGRPVNLEAFRKLADEYNLWIVEDACHAPGGYFVDSKGKIQMCGNGNYANLAIFSFHPVKHIATGEGGMITTNDKGLYEQLLILRTHGITKNPNEFTNGLDSAYGILSSNRLKANCGYPSWYMEMQTLGYNYRLTDIQAALGISQLSRADEGLYIRHKVATKYAKAFMQIDQISDRNRQFTDGSSPLTAKHAFHLYVIEAEDRTGLYNYLREHQIYAQIHYIPVHWMPYYKAVNEENWYLKDAENFYSSCISLPMYPNLKPVEQDYVIERLLNYYFS